MAVVIRLVAAAGSVCLTAGALSGCGAGSRTAVNLAAATPCDFQAPSKRTTVNVLAYNSPSVDPFTNSMVKNCSHNRVTLKHDPIDFAGQVQKTQATLGTAQGTYDILETYGFIIPGLAAQGKLRPLDPYLAKYRSQYRLGGLDRTMFAPMTYRGHVYGLPMQAQALTFAYRKDIFDDLHLKPPKTFDELVAAARRIQASGRMQHPLALPWLSSADLGTAYIATLQSLGRQYVDPRTKKPNFTTAESRQALQTMRSLVPYMDPQALTFDQPKCQQQMYNGTAAMTILFSGRLADLAEEANSRFAKRFAFAAPPPVKKGGRGYVQVSIDGWSIPANTKVDPDLLFRLMAASVGTNPSRAAMPAAYPARTGVVSTAKMPYAPAIRSAIKEAPPAQPYPWVADVSNDTLPVLAQTVSGKLSVDDGMRQMQTIAEKDVAQY